MTMQSWYCEWCKAAGQVPVSDGDGVWVVILRLADNHKARSPSCPMKVGSLRVTCDANLEVRA